MQQFYLEDKPLAFFDIDGVLVRPWIIQYFAEYLANYEHCLFELTSLQKMREELIVYENNSDYEMLAKNWIETYVKGVSGKPIAAIEFASDVFWNLHWNTFVYNYTTDLVRCVSKWCTPVAVSASPLEPVRALCKLLGIDYIEALQVDSHNGLFINAFHGDPNQKGAVIDKYLSEISLENKELSFGFGDTISDYPLFEKVGRAFLFMDTDNTKQKQEGLDLFSQIKAQLPYIELIQRPTTSNFVQAKIWNRLISDR